MSAIMQACILYDAYGTRRIGATRATRYFPAIALVAAEPLEPASASLENLVPPETGAGISRPAAAILGAAGVAEWRGTLPTPIGVKALARLGGVSPAAVRKPRRDCRRLHGSR